MALRDVRRYVLLGVALGAAVSGCVFIDPDDGDTSLRESDNDPSECPESAATDQDCDGVAAAEDCDDTDSSIYPGASDDVGDRIDQDCDGVDGTDSDRDGHASVLSGGTDCNDSDPDVFPGAPEVCDSVDSDCDGDLSDGADAATWFPDEDGDGYGDGTRERAACTRPDGYVAASGDCSDTNEDANPSAREICGNGVDDDCLDGDRECSFQTWQTQHKASLLIQGEEADEYAGCDVKAGDLNGDGIVDLAVGAFGSDLYGSNSGSAYLLTGPLTSGVTGVTSSATATFGGTDYEDGLGFRLDVGDLNQDGQDDLVIGAPYSSTVDGYDGQGAGSVYLWYGAVTAGTHDAGAADFTLMAYYRDDQLGREVHIGGDLTGDGVADLVVGTLSEAQTNRAGRVYVVEGGQTGDLALGDVNRWVQGRSDNDRARVARASSDLDGDGLVDLVVGAPDTDNGEAYVVFGPLADTPLDLADANVTLMGERLNDQAGASVETPGDMDGDGYNDLAIGAKYEDRGGDLAGAVYILTGPTTQASSSLSDVDVKFYGERAGDMLGHALAPLGDLDADGLADLAVLAPFRPSPAGRGEWYLVFGMDLGGTQEISAASGHISVSGEWLEDSLAVAVGLFGDSEPTVLVSSAYADGEEPAAGQVLGFSAR